MNKENYDRKVSALKRFCLKCRIKTRYQITTFTEKTVRKIKLKGNIYNKSAKATIFGIRDRIIKNKEIIAATVVLSCVAVFFIAGAVNSLTVYQYSYGNKVLGIADRTSDIYAGVEEAEKTLTKEVGARVVIDEEEDIAIKRIIKSGKNISEEEDVANALTAIKDFKVVSYGIKIIHGEQNSPTDTTTTAIYLGSKKEANDVIEKVKNEYTKDIDPLLLKEVSIEEEININEEKVYLDQIIDTPGAIKMIMTGGLDEKIHVVKKGDSLASIAEKYDVSRKKLKKWNPKIKDDNIVYLNQEILLQEQIPLLNVITKKNMTITENYNAKIDYNDTDNLYKGQEIIIKKGKSGNRTVNADIIERNGRQIDREILSSVIHREPKAAKVMRGTKERPETIGDGYYSSPMNGTFTSPFGPRWGRVHKGIDIAAPTGCDVRAADAGVVIEAGATSNGYGIAVKIDHGKGRATYYAHNSEVLVKVGDVVYRGQHIAESGNTGYSSGPHLHFETHFNGEAKNPAKYL